MTLISSPVVDSGVTRVICEMVDDRKRKPDCRISIYNLFCFLSRDFYHAKLSTYIAYQAIEKLISRWKYFGIFIYDRGLLRGGTIYCHVRKYLRAKTNINYSRLDSRGDGIIRGFPNGFYLARSCPIGSLILVNTSRKDHNGRHHMRGCAKGTYVPSQRIKWHHDVAFEIPRTGVGEAYC